MEHKNVEDFGMTSEEYQVIASKYNRSIETKSKVGEWEFYIIIFILVCIAFFYSEAVIIILCLVFFWMYCFVCEELDRPIFYYGKFTPPKNYLEYLEYLEKYKIWEMKELEKKNREEEIQRELEEERRKEDNRKNYSYWSSINPYEFEREIALLFEKHGFNSRVTKGSGDGGIDIFLKKDNEKFIVQCKRHKSKAGPSTVRDLYGAMVGGGYNAGFVVCPSGFSKKAFEFSKGKKITLIGLSRIMEMVNNNSVSFLK